jgi:hypothetical protein
LYSINPNKDINEMTKTLVIDNGEAWAASGVYLQNIKKWFFDIVDNGGKTTTNETVICPIDSVTGSRMPKCPRMLAEPYNKIFKEWKAYATNEERNLIDNEMNDICDNSEHSSKAYCDCIGSTRTDKGRFSSHKRRLMEEMPQLTSSSPGCWLPACTPVDPVLYSDKNRLIPSPYYGMKCDVPDCINSVKVVADENIKNATINMLNKCGVNSGGDGGVSGGDGGVSGGDGGVSGGDGGVSGGDTVGKKSSGYISIIIIIAVLILVLIVFGIVIIVV